MRRGDRMPEAQTRRVMRPMVAPLDLRRHMAARSAESSQQAQVIDIFTLGRFSLLRDGSPVAFHRKAPRKVLEVLQALIALGGRDVSIDLLTHAVWPGEKSRDQRNLLDNTLFRLRVVLGHAEAVLLRDSKLTLSTLHCWVDSWAFDRLASQVSDAANNAAVLERILQLYQGHFLDREAIHPWALTYRERLHDRFHHVLITEALRLEARACWRQAADLYERGLQVDRLAEIFYRRLMLCWTQAGERAEALRTYRRCRDILSAGLGVLPSKETEAIRAQAEQA
jgi:DNA-binding SARP family transcriptional activator